MTLAAQGYLRRLGEMWGMLRPWRGSDAGKGLDVWRAGLSPGQTAERVRRAEAPVVCLWLRWGAGSQSSGAP